MGLFRKGERGGEIVPASTYPSHILDADAQRPVSIDQSPRSGVYRIGGLFLTAAGSQLGANEDMIAGLLKKPGYRVAYDLAVDLAGDPEDWDYVEIGSEKRPEPQAETIDAPALTERSGAGRPSTLIEKIGNGVVSASGKVHDLVARAQDVEVNSKEAHAAIELKRFMDMAGYEKPNKAGKNQAIKEMIGMVAPQGKAELSWTLKGMLEDDDERWNGKTWEMCRGASIVVYNQRLAALRLIGPKAARANKIGDRDEYPVWYGHFNQVIAEVGQAATQFMSPPIARSVNGMIGNTIISDYRNEVFSPYSRGQVAQVMLSQVPWHPRLREAQDSLWHNKGFTY